MVRTYSKPNVKLRFSSPTDPSSYGYMRPVVWDWFSDLQSFCHMVTCVIPDATEWFDQFGSTNLLQDGSKVELYLEDELVYVGWIVDGGVSLDSTTRDRRITSVDAMWAVKNSKASIYTGSPMISTTRTLVDATDEDYIFECYDDVPALIVEWNPMIIPVITREIYGDGVIQQVDYVQPSEYQIRYRLGLVIFEKKQLAQYYLEGWDEFTTIQVILKCKFAYYDLSNPVLVHETIEEYLEAVRSRGGVEMTEAGIKYIEDMSIPISHIDWDVDSGIFEDFFQFLKDEYLIPPNFHIFAQPVPIPDTPGAAVSFSTPLIDGRTYSQGVTPTIEIDHEMVIDLPSSLEDCYPRIELMTSATMGEDITKRTDLTYSAPFGATLYGFEADKAFGWEAVGGYGLFPPPETSEWRPIKSSLKYLTTDGDMQSLFGVCSMWNAQAEHHPSSMEVFPYHRPEYTIDQDLLFLIIDLQEDHEIHKVAVGMAFPEGSPIDMYTGKVAEPNVPESSWWCGLSRVYDSVYHNPILSVYGKAAADPLSSYAPLSDNSMYFGLDPIGEDQIHECTNINRKQIRQLLFVFNSPWYVRISKGGIWGDLYRGAFYFLSNVWVLSRGVIKGSNKYYPSAEITKSPTGTPLVGAHNYPIGTVATSGSDDILVSDGSVFDEEQPYTGEQISVPARDYVGIIRHVSGATVTVDTNFDTNNSDPNAAGVQAGDWWVMNSLRYKKDLLFIIRDFYRPQLYDKFLNTRLPNRTLTFEEVDVSSYEESHRFCASKLWEKIRDFESFRTTIPYRPDIRLGQTIKSTCPLCPDTYMVTSFRMRGAGRGETFIDLEFTNFNKGIS